MRNLLISISIIIVLGSCVKRPELVIVVPSDREIKNIPGEPGWFKISAGHLEGLYEQQRILLEELEKCQSSDNKI